ncbi:UPF0598 protein C8orf82 homolog [Chelonoidis abingdonii]|uniref:UPF0598 protein C8orf82 homolog n=1 Tax=Chelonoidis abingdonii TaxID=106734 RepID=UPI0013F255E3|nr:UPF0598 protein C8orf82 homolog [Chelonoidis abingdonii]XP_032646879.1 UPF0598 protein C8orf82 homolog [Chelonoidis abingdonii]
MERRPRGGDAAWPEHQRPSSLHNPRGYWKRLATPLFLDDAKVKNFITCFKDKQFLTFFFKQLQLNRSGRYQDAFPYLSPCGREHNFVRCDDRPIVFTHLLWGQAGEELLSYCGGGDSLVVSFEPEKLVMFPENGRVYHPAPQKAGGVGLVKSALAFELSPCFEYSQGASGPPTHFRWQGKRYTLTNELVQLIRLNSSA